MYMQRYANSYPKYEKTEIEVYSPRTKSVLTLFLQRPTIRDSGRGEKTVAKNVEGEIPQKDQHYSEATEEIPYSVICSSVI